MSDVVLETDGVRKEFGEDDRILTGADLQIKDGEIVVLMGPNGVGKTVLLSCLAGGDVPTEGTVDVFGEPVEETGHNHLTFMMQDSVAVEKLSARENAQFYANLQPQFSDRWERYVEQLGIDAELDKLVENYSEGMKRKLEFSLAMSSDVPLYLLDEPTAGVDLRNVQRFHDIILDHYEQGKTFVMSSHRPMDANIADRIAFMPEGIISAVGTPSELMEAVPPVVTVSGREAMQTASSFVVDGELFPVGGEARGFLAPDCTISDLRNAIDSNDEGVAVEKLDPTYTDLFNYYIHIEP